jgi:hypothetical protein
MKNTVLNFVRSNWLLLAALAGILWWVGVRVYYRLKPWMPYRFRLFLRRRMARRQLKTHAHEWPILEAAGAKPDWFQGWPGGKRFSFVITHDVELQKGLDRVKQLAEVEMAHGFRSSFNFIPEGPYRVPDDLREWLEQNGFEVGVHDHRHDGMLYKSRENFLASAARINHFVKEWNARGFRSGFMLRNLEWIEDLNISYDASTFDTDPFEPQPDGAKTIFPFWHAGQHGRGYMELPYTLVQDSTLFVLLGETTDAVWRRKCDWIVRQSGTALINVHPDYVAFKGNKAETGEFPVHIYESFLKWMKETHGSHCWHALPHELAEECRRQIFQTYSMGTSAQPPAPEKDAERPALP